MKIILLADDKDLNITITGKITKNEEVWVKNVLDHAWLRKTDVNFDSENKILVVKLNRYEYGTRAKKEFLGCTIWNNSIPPTKQTLLTIRDVEACDIRDEDSKTAPMQEVIIGGLAFNNNEIYLGSFCQHENSYGITLRVKKINVTLEDA